MEIGKDFKYKLVKNFITKDEVDLFGIYAEIKHKTNFTSFDLKQSNVGDTMFYGDAAAEALLLKYKDKVSQITNKKLLPTYSFWRMYTKNAILKPHTDRPSCEISVTIMLSSDGTKWPIFVDGNAVELNPGDGVIYLGQELKHWREQFKGDYHSQVFLHYVDEEGKNKEWYMDKRQFWGDSK